ncbi:MAG: hypothetical protein LC620_01100, partial [Halobacteriales archaeon]|nr:hypothetical protein [Halobacteriales archaeon]
FTFSLQVADLKLGKDGAGQDGWLDRIQFKTGGRSFQVNVVEQLPGVIDGTSAWLEFRDADNQPWNQVWYRPNGAVLDAAAETVTVAVLRSDLADAHGASPYPGRTLDGFQVLSHNLFGGNDGHFLCCIANQGVDDPAYFTDAMPDGGPASVSYSVQLGLKQEGHARLASDEPFRASNGEATTFIYRVKGVNIGDAKDTFQLRATKVPAGWNIVLPQPTLDIEAGADLEVPVVANVPFNHVHGSAASFVLEMTSNSDPGSVGRLEVGVRYLAIPQPAGHHNQLYFHSHSYGQLNAVFGQAFEGNDGYSFMNALDTFDGDEGIPLSPQGNSWDMGNLGEPEGIFSWCVALDPGLQMGLDFSVAGKGNLSVPIHATAPLNAASLTARLYLVPEDANRYGCYYGFGGEEPFTLASLNDTAGIDIPANSDKVLQGTLDVWHVADRIPYVKGQNILLYVEVRGVAAPSFLAPGTPKLVPGGMVQLPLLEYHDDVKEVLTTLKGPALTPLGPQERHANPGSTVVFPVSVANDADRELVLDFNVTGTNSAWAALPTGGSVGVPAHGTARADVVVHVPAGAKQGDTADLVVQAYDAADAASRGLLRVVVTVETDQKLPDDAAVAPKADAPHRSPAWASVGMIGALALVALRRRDDIA